MADTMSIQVRVSFTNETSIGDYSDCLIYELSDFFKADGTRKITNPELHARIQARANKWANAVKAARENATPPVETTEEELAQSLTRNDLRRLKAYLAARPELTD